MKKIDEAIELLKPVPERRGWNDSWAAGRVFEALALLESAKAEPEAGEFTTEFDALLYQRRNDIPFYVLRKAKQACDRLDTKDEQIAALNADKVQLENDACVARGEIDRLTAEKKRLLTPTDCETESEGIL